MNRALLLPLLFAVLFSSCKTPAEMIEAGDAASARQAFEGGADVNDRTGCFTPLMAAAWKGHTELVAFLLSKGADPKARSRECDYVSTVNLGGYVSRAPFKWGNRTALDNAANAEIVKLLLEKGADPNLGGYRQFRTWTDYEHPLMNAYFKKDLAMVQALVEAGASVNPMSRDGKNRAFAWEEKDEARLRIRAYLTSRGAQHPDLNDALAEATDKQKFTTYRHVPTGAVTVMGNDIASALHAAPQRFAPMTMNAADNKYYHYSEFVWVDNGQNMFEWYLLRRKRVTGKFD